VNFPFICNNIPAAPAYGVYNFQLMRYSRDYGSHHECLDRKEIFTATDNMLESGTQDSWEELQEEVSTSYI
jgi:hypothetical protein